MKSHKKLTKILAKHSGRDEKGRVSVRHQGGREKRFLREIDWKRRKFDIPARVASLEYDPNRTANIALLYYADGEKKYILAPEGLKVNDEIISGQKVALKIGNSLPLKNIPVGTAIHNLELKSGKGAQTVRAAGTSAQILAKEKGMATVKLASGEQRLIPLNCLATIGQVGNAFLKTVKLVRAGQKRHRGVRPSVRGVSMDPSSHPHGGGEGRSGIGMPSPKSPWGKKTLGKKTRKSKKYSDQSIIKRRK